MSTYAIVIHGGAGTILPAAMTNELERSYKTALQEAMDAGFSCLSAGGTSVEAVKAAVISLEDCILFNAGRGSVFTKTGGHEMDAAIMDGKTLGAGAVAGVGSVKNPVLLAKLIMEKSEHVMLSGDGALQFAKQHQLQLEEEDLNKLSDVHMG